MRFGIEDPFGYQCRTSRFSVALHSMHGTTILRSGKQMYSGNLAFPDAEVPTNDCSSGRWDPWQGVNVEHGLHSRCSNHPGTVPRKEMALCAHEQCSNQDSILQHNV